MVVIPRIDGNMDALEAHGRSLRGVGVAVADIGERIDTTWQGLAAVYHAPEAAQLFAATGPVRQMSVSVGEDIGLVGGVLVSYAGEVRQIQARLDALRAELAQIESAVHSLGPRGSAAGQGMVRESGIAARVAAAVADFEDAQRRCANAINALFRPPPSSLSAAGASLPLVYRPPDGDGVVEPGEYGTQAATVSEVAAWWAALSDGQRRQVLGVHPEWVGNLDGIPARDRDVANRSMLRTESARLDGEIAADQARLDALTAQPIRPPGGRGAGASPAAVAISVLAGALAVKRERRAALAAVENTIDVDPNRQLLLLDITHERPRAAVAVGDVDTATHVAVFTPGMTTAVSKDIGGYTKDMRAVRDKALFELDRAGRGGETVAAVTWIGYEPPDLTFGDNLFSVRHNVALSQSARAGAVDLARFYEGIDASRPGHPPHLTALGHSYGSTTTGYALQKADGVDDALVFGSPGLGVADVGDLHVPAGHVAVLEAEGDSIADLGRFEADPNHLDGVTNLSSRSGAVPGTGEALTASTGHSAYLTPGTTSQYNIAVTVAGLPEKRVVGDNGNEDFFDLDIGI